MIERQRRELVLARADAQAAEVAAMARGVLMERQGLSPVAAIRQLADMAAAAGIPVTEMAAAVLRQEPPSRPADSAPPDPRLDGAEESLALAAITRARDGVELVGALAGQLGPRFEAAAVAVWLLDADGALELLGQDGLDGTDSSRWRRLPPQFDCPEQRVVADGVDLWWEAGPPPSDPVAVAAPWGRNAARAVLALRDRAGILLGVAEAWWRGPRREFDADTRGLLAAMVAGFADVLGVRLAYGHLGAGTPSPAVFAALDQIADSVLLARPLRGAGGEITDFAIMYLSPGYADPLGRPAAELAALTLLEAYPASASGDGLYARAERVLASGHAEHVPGTVSAPLTGAADAAGNGGDAGHAVIADLTVIPFFAGVLFTWRTPGEAERLAELLGHAQRLGSIGGWEEQLAAGDHPLDRFRVRAVRARSGPGRADSDRPAAQLRDRGRPRAGPPVPGVAAAAPGAGRGGVPHRPAGRHRDQADQDLRRAGRRRRRPGRAARRLPGRLRAVPHPGRAGRHPRPAGRQRAARGRGAPARAPPAAGHHGRRTSRRWRPRGWTSRSATARSSRATWSAATGTTC